VYPGAIPPTGVLLTADPKEPDTNVSKTVIGTTINITGTTVNTLFGSNTILYTTLTVVGRDSGARLFVPVQITQVNQ